MSALVNVYFVLTDTMKVGALLFSLLACVCNGELFTAIVDLERILYTEYSVAQDLRSYIAREQQRIDALRRYSNRFPFT